MNPEQDSIIAGLDVPARVAAALAACDEQSVQASALPTGTPGEQAARAQRLALLCARRAGWWGVLHAGSRHAGVPAVYRRALIYAQAHERENARFWRSLARDWQTCATRRDAGSGPWAMWDDGVTGAAS